MKKLSYLLFVCLFAFSSVFVSCSEDDDNPFSDPTIEVKLTAGSSSATNLTNKQEITAYETGEKLDFAIRFSMGDDKLTAIKITAKIAGETFTEVDSTLNEGLFSGAVRVLDYKYGTIVGNNEKTITFSTTDKKNRVADFTVTIKPKTAAEQTGEFIIGRATLMGAHKNTTYGSFYSVDLGEVFMINAANGKSGKDIDFAYFYGATNHATIAAPINTNTQTMFPTVANWTTRNDTRFYVASTTTVNFASMDEAWYDEQIALVTASDLTMANQLAVGNVIAYKTKGGKTGLFEVEKLDATVDGTITIKLVTKK